MKVLIVGGVGNMGQWFTAFFTRLGLEVTVYDLHPATGAVVSDLKKRMESEGIRYEGRYIGELSGLSEYDLIVISVPMEEVRGAVKSCAPQMREGSLLMDITSVKSEPIRAMADYAPPGVSIVGIHPLYGYNVDSIRGHTVALTKMEGRCSDFWEEWLKNTFQNAGAAIITTTPEHHDRMMSYVQTLVHFVYLALGRTLMTKGVDVGETYNFRTPFYEVIFHFLGRLLGQDPGVYASIQMNSYIADVREAFIAQCIELSKVVKSQDRDVLIEEIKEIADHFGQHNIGFGLMTSKKIVNHLVNERTNLLGSVGKVKGVKNLKNGAIHVGRVKAINPDSILLVEGGGREVSLNFKNAEMLSDEELYRWKVSNLKPKVADISVVASTEVDPDILCEILSQVDGAISVSIIDRYQGSPIKPGLVGLTFRINMVGDAEVEPIVTKVRTILKRLGCKMREEYT